MFLLISPSGNKRGIACLCVKRAMGHELGGHGGHGITPVTVVAQFYVVKGMSVFRRSMVVGRSVGRPLFRRLLLLDHEVKHPCRSIFRHKV